MTSLAERAQSAAVFITHTAATSPYGPYRGEERARTAIRLASVLGLGLAHITIAPDRFRPRTALCAPALATVTCPDTQETYTFRARDPLYDDDPFELLGPCPECTNPVPLAEVRHLADLGNHLTHAPYNPEVIAEANKLPDTFWLDSGHTDTCRYGEVL
ncbi:hypothetical protein [Streptomyces sp. NPDC051561]|uniref:hypothetical protein n=1 Tax=Streptomyces sp. NPDC051561 TaxID=3365658 RepID=UPI0037BDAE98